jgi:hypothetical protein
MSSLQARNSLLTLTRSEVMDEVAWSCRAICWID